LNTDREIALGDVILADLGCIYDGYVADINRTLYVGGPTERQAEVLLAANTLTQEAINNLKPGVPASEVYHRVRQHAEQLGYGPVFNQPFIGHSIGLSLHENPYIEPSNDNMLE